MKRLLISIYLFVFVAFPVLAGQYPVVKVIDGDTIDVMYNGKTERIRMLCVDTPESVHPDKSRNTQMGKEASDYTKHRLEGKTVDLEFETKTRGKYGRLLAYVILDGQNYNVELVTEGWSPYYTKYGNSEKHHEEFLAAEEYAKNKGQGVWASGTTIEAKNPQSVDGKYHGNTSSLKFHRVGCKYYNCENCTKVFSTREEAISLGYTPCGICKP